MKPTYHPFLKVLITVPLWVLLACGGRSPSADAPPATRTPAQQAASARYNDSVARVALAGLHTGDVLLRMGRSPESYLLAHLNLRDQSFSHCGIVVIENDTPVVYHSIGGEDNPDERLRRDPLSQFVTATNNSSFGVVTYNFSDSDRSRLADTVRRFYARRPFFDLDFDLNTDEKLYCTEFVYKAMMHTFADSSLIGLSTGHGRRFIGIDDLYSSSRARFATRVNYK